MRLEFVLLSSLGPGSSSVELFTWEHVGLRRYGRKSKDRAWKLAQERTCKGEWPHPKVEIQTQASFVQLPYSILLPVHLFLRLLSHR
ncbi:hypothetical protein GQ53DRAFT_751353 [Thozetella sp. PMI_491]|nr:hypothetical protein GQ53DRAFT_751353 [Thozetella sp. PMI_491]